MSAAQPREKCKYENKENNLGNNIYEEGKKTVTKTVKNQVNNQTINFPNIGSVNDLRDCEFKPSISVVVKNGCERTWRLKKCLREKSLVIEQTRHGQFPGGPPC